MPCAANIKVFASTMPQEPEQSISTSCLQSSYDVKDFSDPFTLNMLDSPTVMVNVSGGLDSLRVYSTRNRS
jgi:hypothetical protein